MPEPLKISAQGGHTPRSVDFERAGRIGKELDRRLFQSPNMGDAKNFSSGRQVAAWLDLVPRQHSSGGKPTLLGMGTRGDSYLRTLLIHGARSVIYKVRQKADPSSWLNQLIQRRNLNVAAVALANKNARIVWALLAHEREFRSDCTRAGAPAQPDRREKFNNVA